MYILFSKETPFLVKILFFSTFFCENYCDFRKKRYLCTAILKRKHAQMAESVDALVSNTSGFTSIPVRPRVWVQEEKFERASLFLFCYGNICAYKNGL